MRKHGQRSLVGATFLLLATLPVAAFAQGYRDGNRAGHWEIGFQARLLFGESLDFEGGTTVETDDDLGFGFGLGYHLNDKLLLAGEFAFNSVDYDGTLASGDTPPAAAVGIAGSVETSSLGFSATWHFMERDITPFVSAGLGWTWVDTNIASGPPQTGCWWDPWWGYICTGFQPTRTEDAFNYSLGAGVRWDYGSNLFFRGSYDIRWVDFDNSDTPDFGLLRLEFGVKY
jgi:opacity protein-like surface antigen